MIENGIGNSSSNTTWNESNNNTNELIDPIVLSTKRVVFVGGLPETTTISMIRSIMIPFGPIQNIDMPMDYIKGIHRGFAFIEYESVDDAIEAIYNLDGSELLGQTISVNVAQPNQMNRLSSISSNPHHNTTSSQNGGGGSSSTTHGNHEAIWTSDEWYQKQINNSGTTLQEERIQQSNEQDDIRTLQNI